MGDQPSVDGVGAARRPARGDADDPPRDVERRPARVAAADAALPAPLAPRDALLRSAHVPDALDPEPIAAPAVAAVARSALRVAEAHRRVDLAVLRRPVEAGREGRDLAGPDR